jgi:2-keto-4-pentenoate hydratase/2-oxohepta-3-ene-1,7-dioic acid hydratase in catechol pathway
MFMKNPDAVIGPGDTIELPEFTVPWMFMHEAELALVIKGPAKMVKRESWRDAVFGYTCLIDVTARGEGRRTWPHAPLTSWLGKSFDTFAPLGLHRDGRRIKPQRPRGALLERRKLRPTTPTTWSTACPNWSNGPPR